MRTTNSVTRRSIGAIFTTLVVATMTMSSHADTVTFKDGVSPTGGYTGTEDVSIFKDAPNASYSIFAVDYAGAYSSGTGIRRTIMRFDVSALAGQFTQITSITLKLYPNSLDAPHTFSNTLDVYQIAAANAAWAEGTSQGSTALTGEPSWNNRAAPSTTWAGSAGLITAGTDYTTLLTSAAYGDTTVMNDTNSPLGGGMSFAGSPAALTALINTWLTPGGNAGLLLIAANESTADDQLIKLNSADSLSSTSLHPELVITFIPEPSSALLALGGTILIWRRRS